jgi:agmatine deiminase
MDIATRPEASHGGASPDGAHYRMPAEWEPHDAVWLQWPDRSMAAHRQMKLEATWFAMVAAMAGCVPVRAVVSSDASAERLQGQLEWFGLSDGVEPVVIPIDDVWARDSGPVFVLDEAGSLTVTDWNFNGWGARFDHPHDRGVAKAIAARLGVPHLNPSTTLEGGALEVNGTGCLIATESSIVNDNRNPGSTRSALETELVSFLGVRNVIWLDGAPKDVCDAFGDVTDWHVDIAARFTGRSTVLYCWTEDRADPRYPHLVRHREQLEQATDETGGRLELVALPTPDVRSVSAETYGVPFDRHPGSVTDAAYTNYLVTNGVVLLPVYGRPEDEEAKAIIREQCPGREVVGIPSLTLTEEGGAVHCVTQQQPASSGP